MKQNRKLLLHLWQNRHIFQWRPGPDCRCEILVETSILLTRPGFLKPTDTFSPNLCINIDKMHQLIIMQKSYCGLLCKSNTNNRISSAIKTCVPSFLSSSSKFWNSEWKISRCFSIRTFSHTRAK